MAKKVAFSGICVAMALVCMLLTAALPVNTLFLLCLSTVFIPLVLVKCGRIYSVCALIAAAVLVFVFVPDKILCVEFALLGIYTVCKSVIEQIGRLWAEWGIKLALYFAVAAAFCRIFFQSLQNAVWLVLAGAVIFIIYDIVLSIGITYLIKK